MNSTERAHLLRSLHRKGNPLVLYNVWDAGSAMVVQESGADAVATGSWSVAAAHGFSDGEEMPFDFALANLKRIVRCVHLPVTIDLEGGYGQIRESVSKVLQAGAVGINFEDQIIGGKGLHPPEAQSSRIRAIRQEADDAAIPLFINARTDVFLQTQSHTDHELKEALYRASSYADSGADGFFAPGLRDIGLIEQLCKAAPLPVNIMILANGPSPKQLAEAGVARISYGPIPYRLVMNALRQDAQRALHVFNAPAPQ